MQRKHKASKRCWCFVLGFCKSSHEPLNQQSHLSDCTSPTHTHTHHTPHLHYSEVGCRWLVPATPNSPIFPDPRQVSAATTTSHLTCTSVKQRTCQWAMAMAKRSIAKTYFCRSKSYKECTHSFQPREERIARNPGQRERLDHLPPRIPNHIGTRDRTVHMQTRVGKIGLMLLCVLNQRCKEMLTETTTCF